MHKLGMNYKSRSIPRNNFYAQTGFLKCGKHKIIWRVIA